VAPYFPLPRKENTSSNCANDIKYPRADGKTMESRGKFGAGGFTIPSLSFR